MHKSAETSISTNKKMFAFFWETMKPYKWWYLLLLQAPILSAFYFLFYHYSIKLLVDTIISIKEFSAQPFIFPIALFLFSDVYLNILWRISNIAAWKCLPFTTSAIISKTFNYIQQHSYTYFQNTQSGSILSKAKGIVDGFDNIFEAIHYRFSTLISNSLVCIASIAIVSPSLALFVTLWGVLFSGVMYQFYKKINHLSFAENESKHKVFAIISDCITNIFTVFSFASRKMEFKKVQNQLYQDFATKQIKTTKYHFKIGLIGWFFYTLILLGSLSYVIYLRYSDEISVGDVVFILSLLASFLENCWHGVEESGNFLRQVGDLRSSFEIINQPNEIDINQHNKLEINQPSIEFKNIQFTYRDEKTIFKNLNLKIRAGEKVGLVGFSGAGKSSLVSLLLRYFDVQSGEVCIGGKNIANYSKDSVRQHIGLIPQEVMLFHRSILENICYGNTEASEEEVIKATKTASIHDFIESLPEKYNTLVGERGVRLSGGQRQRIAIARAILKGAPILILDEATSSLDTKTEIEIQKSIELMFQNIEASVIAIAHRLSTLRNMDRIVVLDQGEIIEEGKHDELLAKPNSFYKKLWDMNKI